MTVSPEATSATPSGSPCSRRRFLLGTAATAAGALIAACASKDAVESIAAADIPVGGGIVLDKYVVTQPKKGVFKAFSNVCPHQGGTINEVADGAMICPNHNSHFDIETGAVISGPSRQPAGTADLKADGQNLVVGQ